MREFLTSGVVGNIEYNAQKQIREDVQKRWESLGFTEGLQEGAIKENIATLYENEAKYLLKEATAADNSGSFETVVFPIIRRVFSKLLANDIVSVQAMNLPVGKLFFILPVTSEREWTSPGSTASNNGDIVDVESYLHVCDKVPDIKRVMIGRGMFRNPGLIAKLKEKPYAAADYKNRLREFHDEIYNGFRSIFSGEKDALFRMKEVWSYLRYSFEDSDKYWKKIRKVQHHPDYVSLVNQLFAELTLQEL